jgi:hypothetical protein
MSNVIQVKGKQLVMEVLLDAAGNYSVCGYAERMEKAFGLIFLGRDKTDPDYAAQSAAANAAIGAITERDAFDAALQATRTAMQSIAGAETFDMKDVSNQVLAALCTLWFDVPDGDSMVMSGSFLPFRPARCPGHFAPPSGYIFEPEPGFFLSLLGKMDGGILRTQVAQFVARHRQAGTQPAGSISRALFAAFPSSEQNDLLARTIVGVMMGFLPTAQGNLTAVAKAWAGSTFQQLRGAYLGWPEPDLYLRAGQVIRQPMIQAIQAEPMPPAIWRTAVRDHQLGNPPVDVMKDDRLHINLDSAMREDLANGTVDPMPVFGGDRSQAAHPTHACPGYKAAMGAMLGTLAGTLEAGPVLKTGWSLF